MKICIDARFFGNENGGLGRYTMQLVDHLGKLDKSNNYILLLREKYYKSESFPDNFQKVLCDIPHYSLKEQIVLPLILKRLKVDLVHFPHFNVPVLYFDKKVVTIHDLLMHDGVGKKATTLPFWKYALKRLGYRFVFDNAVFSASRIIVPSQHVLSELGKSYLATQGKTSVIYEGVTELPKVSGDKIAGKVLYVGNTYPHKNVDTLIKAISVLVDKNVNVKLTLVVPRDNFIQRLKSTVKESGVLNNVEIKSYLSDADLAYEYQTSEVFVYPSFSEGFGLQGLEALSKKCLFCCSDIPIFKEVYGKSAIYFNPHSHTELADTINSALSLTKSKKSDIFSEFEIIKKKYDWGVMARRTIKVYEDCLGV